MNLHHPIHRALDHCIRLKKNLLGELNLSSAEQATARLAYIQRCEEHAKLEATAHADIEAIDQRRKALADLIAQDESDLVGQEARIQYLLIPIGKLRWYDLSLSLD